MKNNWLIEKIILIWRKKYLWLFFFIGVIGTPLLLSFKSTVNDFLIFYTLIVLLWYTRETMDLKRNSNKELKLLKEAEMNKMMPILLFEPGARLHRDGNLSGFRITNYGQGVARDVLIILSSIEIEKNFSLAPKNQRDIRVSGNITSIVDALKQEPFEINMEIRYKDVYERRFRTVEITFIKSDGGNYDLDRGRWKFQILD